ncbi:hypothetical protein RAAC3_TM7C00001G0132 [Candidatus Saccharibacteria bacterium RAAC3_TM7_1]|nr:hypothetical protein RAAC3_TM7C00001G0132 [Candidatus Saccharibacteria bacterium RAAC3_TM7_1]HCZ28837.1 hypothetical protein [Candidatus Saccharibacteria bacterium]
MIKYIIVGVVVVLLGVAVFTGDSLNKGAGQAQPGTSFDALVGRPASDFTLTSYDGKDYTLSQLKGKKVILFFNEGLMCYPACWNQIAALGTDEQLNSGDVVALSIVGDARDGWREAIDRMPDLGKGTILLDSDKSVSRQYDMLNLPSSMHSGMLPGHTFVLVDEKGIVRYTFDDPKMGNRNDMLLKEIKKMEEAS